MAKAPPPVQPAANDYAQLLEKYFEMCEEEDRLAAARAALAHRLHQARAEQKGREIGDHLARTAVKAEVAEAERATKPSQAPKAN